MAAAADVEFCDNEGQVRLSSSADIDSSSTRASPTTLNGRSRLTARFGMLVFTADPIDLALYGALFPISEVHHPRVPRSAATVAPIDAHLDEIRRAPTPAESKKLGYSRRPDYRTDWEVQCIRIKSLRLAASEDKLHEEGLACQVFSAPRSPYCSDRHWFAKDCGAQ